jgi:hypothetical protein
MKLVVLVGFVALVCGAGCGGATSDGNGDWVSAPASNTMDDPDADTGQPDAGGSAPDAEPAPADDASPAPAPDATPPVLDAGRSTSPDSGAVVAPDAGVDASPDAEATLDAAPAPDAAPTVDASPDTVTDAGVPFVNLPAGWTCESDGQCQSSKYTCYQQSVLACERLTYADGNCTAGEAYTCSASAIDMWGADVLGPVVAFIRPVNAPAIPILCLTPALFCSNPIFGGD